MTRKQKNKKKRERDAYRYVDRRIAIKGMYTDKNLIIKRIWKNLNWESTNK